VAGLVERRTPQSAAREKERERGRERERERKREREMWCLGVLGAKRVRSKIKSNPHPKNK